MDKLVKSLFHVIYILELLLMQNFGCSGSPRLHYVYFAGLAAYLMTKNKAIIGVAQLFVLRHNT